MDTVTGHVSVCRGRMLSTEPYCGLFGAKPVPADPPKVKPQAALPDPALKARYQLITVEQLQALSRLLDQPKQVER